MLLKLSVKSAGSTFQIVGVARHDCQQQSCPQ